MHKLAHTRARARTHTHTNTHAHGVFHLYDFSVSSDTKSKWPLPDRAWAEGQRQTKEFSNVLQHSQWAGICLWHPLHLRCPRPLLRRPHPGEVTTVSRQLAWRLYHPLCPWCLLQRVFPSLASLVSPPPPVILVSPSKGLRHLLWPWRFPRCLHHPLRPWCLPQSVFTTSCDLGAFLTVSSLPVTLAPSSQCLHHFMWPWRLPHSVFTTSCDHGVSYELLFHYQPQDVCIFIKILWFLKSFYLYMCVCVLFFILKTCVLIQSPQGIKCPALLSQTNKVEPSHDKRNSFKMYFCLQQSDSDLFTMLSLHCLLF